MNLRAVDLNLLVIFDTLMCEKHVTRAARKVPMSQPAMSSALARLRVLFADELFIRVNGQMEPTPRAIEISTGVTRILKEAERLMLSEVSFDPSVSGLTFSGRMADLMGSMLLPDLLASVTSQAPGVKINIEHTPIDKTITALEDGNLDFAVSSQLRHTSGVISEPVITDRLVCIMRPQHPLTSGELTLDAFLNIGHLHVATSSSDVRFVDDLLSGKRLRRNIAVTIPHWLTLPFVLARTDLISVVSEKMATTPHFSGLVIKALPFDAPPFSWNLYWHKRDTSNVAHLWLREQIFRVCSLI